jgi:IclR family mhp operon transcriptional activator
MGNSFSNGPVGGEVQAEHTAPQGVTPASNGRAAQVDAMTAVRKSESIRPIRALLRGLDSLRSLNAHNGVTVTEIAEETRLPRTTAYRILETLCVGGYAVRDPADDRYRPTIFVRALSEGFEDEPWVREIAKPEIERLCKEIVWPIAVATLSGTTMLIRETTDKNSPLALERYSAGIRVPILSAAGGRVYLAFCPVEQRETLLKILSHSEVPSDSLARESGAVERMLSEARQNGYAFHVRESHRETTVAVPIMSEGKILASLVMRYMSSALTPPQVVKDHVPRLKAVAKTIGDAFTRQSVHR